MVGFSFNPADVFNEYFAATQHRSVLRALWTFTSSQSRKSESPKIVAVAKIENPGYLGFVKVGFSFNPVNAFNEYFTDTSLHRYFSHTSHFFDKCGIRYLPEGIQKGDYRGYFESTWTERIRYIGNSLIKEKDT